MSAPDQALSLSCDLEGDATDMGLQMAGELVSMVADAIGQAGGQQEVLRFYIALVLACLHQAGSRLGAPSAAAIAQHAVQFMGTPQPATPH